MSFINDVEAFKIVLALSSYFEHKENSRILIIADFTHFNHFFDSKLTRKHYSDTQIGIYSLGASINFINIHDLSDSVDIEQFEELLDEFELDFDLNFVLFPKEMYRNSISDHLKALMFKCSNVSYVLNTHGTDIRELDNVRRFFEGNGVEEGGVIIGEDYE